MSNNTATNAFYFNFCNAFAKQFQVDLTEAAIKELGANVKADAKNILKVTNPGIIKFSQEKAKYTKTTANKYAAVTEKLNKSLEQSVLDEINAYIDKFLGYCSKNGNKIVYANDEDDPVEYEFTVLTEESDDEKAGEDDDDIAAAIAATPTKSTKSPVKQKGINKPSASNFDDDDDDIAPAQTRKSTTRVATAKTPKSGTKTTTTANVSTKASAQLDKKWLQLTVMKGVENVKAFYNDKFEKNDVINKENPLNVDIEDEAELNTTILTEYGNMYKDLLAATIAEKEKSKSKTKTKTEYPTNKEIDAFIAAAATALNAENALLEHYAAAEETISKIDCKALSKEFPTVYILSITKKVLEGKKATNVVEEYTAPLDDETEANIKKNYKKKQLKQTTTGTQLLKKLIKINKIDDAELAKCVQAFYDSYVKLLKLTTKVKKIKVGIAAFNHDVFCNSENLYTFEINAEFKYVHPIEAHIYKHFGLLSGKYITETQNRQPQLVESSSMYTSYLHIALHDFSKPISAKIFETIFNNRFSYITDDKETKKLVRNAFTQAAANLAIYIDENPDDEIAKIWFNIVKADILIRGIVNNNQLSKSFLTAFKALYSNKLSYKLYIGPLYPISFLFTPFMLKVTDRKAITEMNKLFKEYIDSKAKTVSTAFNKKFFNEYTEAFVPNSADWIYYLRQNCKDEDSAGEDLHIMSILYNKFDKGEISDEKETKADKGTDEENEENDDENDDENDEDKEDEK